MNIHGQVSRSICIAAHEIAGRIMLTGFKCLPTVEAQFDIDGFLISVRLRDTWSNTTAVRRHVLPMETIENWVNFRGYPDLPLARMITEAQDEIVATFAP